MPPIGSVTTRSGETSARGKLNRACIHALGPHILSSPERRGGFPNEPFSGNKRPRPNQRSLKRIPSSGERCGALKRAPGGFFERDCGRPMYNGTGLDTPPECARDRAPVRPAGLTSRKRIGAIRSAHLIGFRGPRPMNKVSLHDQAHGHRCGPPGGNPSGRYHGSTG